MKLLFLWIFFLPITLRSQELKSIIGASANGTGNCAITRTDVFSIVNNNAASTSLTNVTLGFFTDTRYLVPEVYSHQIVLGLPTSFSTIGLGFKYQGFDAYNRINSTISIAKSITKKLNLGVQLYYTSTHTSEKYNQQTLSPRISVLTSLNDLISIGGTYTFYENMHNICFGGSYEENTWGLYSDLNWTVASPSPNINIGVEYKIYTCLVIRTGITQNLSYPTLGMGLFTGRLNINTSIIYHQYLGFSPTFDLIYHFEK